MRNAHDVVPLFQDIQLSLTATSAAKSLGLKSAERLERMLADRRIRPFYSLRDWHYVVEIVDRFSMSDTSIAHWALARGEYPSVYYRFVRRVTRLSWTDIRSREPTWTRENALRDWRRFILDKDL